MKGIRRGGALAAILMALPMSQLGHLLAYWLQFGPAAAARQSTGAHAYFPVLLQAGGATLGAALLGLLLLLAVARFMVGLRNDRVPEGGWPVGPLLLTLLGAQLAIFAGQELVEASLSALPAAPAGHLLVWGVAGQLPLAILGAFGLSWISARVRRAVRRLRRSRMPGLAPRGALLPELPWAPAIFTSFLPAFAAGFVNRGPPFSPPI
ncbi:MAG: hypothetical protein M3Z98_04940 [Candidatus Dormibacteraeota bacterium]|nr:hypothetical protein [Candidatus Dormibacteraeota bacterium]